MSIPEQEKRVEIGLITDEIVGGLKRVRTKIKRVDFIFYANDHAYVPEPKMGGSLESSSIRVSGNKGIYIDFDAPQGMTGTIYLDHLKYEQLRQQLGEDDGFKDRDIVVYYLGEAIVGIEAG